MPALINQPDTDGLAGRALMTLVWSRADAGAAAHESPVSPARPRREGFRCFVSRPYAGWSHASSRRLPGAVARHGDPSPAAGRASAAGSLPRSENARRACNGQIAAISHIYPRSQPSSSADRFRVASVSASADRCSLRPMSARIPVHGPAKARVMSLSARDRGRQPGSTPRAARQFGYERGSIPPWGVALARRAAFDFYALPRVNGHQMNVRGTELRGSVSELRPPHRRSRPPSGTILGGSFAAPSPPAL